MSLYCNFHLQVCDWKRDCPDQSDEEKICRWGSEGKCPDFMFSCGPKSQACISKVIFASDRNGKFIDKVFFVEAD